MPDLSAVLSPLRRFARRLLAGVDRALTPQAGPVAIPVRPSDEARRRSDRRR